MELFLLVFFSIAIIIMIILASNNNNEATESIDNKQHNNINESNSRVDNSIDDQHSCLLETVPITKQDTFYDSNIHNTTFQESNTINEISHWLDNYNGDIFIVLDLETNGLSNKRSVLSITAIKYRLDPHEIITPIDYYERYYYPIEEYDPIATSINGLVYEVIAELRKRRRYSKYFQDDNSFESFSNNVEYFIGHNIIGFDSKFIKFLDNRILIDTMLLNTDIVKARWLAHKNGWKWPTLEETALFYEINVKKDTLHLSSYDVQITAEIFKRMLLNSGFYSKIKDDF